MRFMKVLVGVALAISCAINANAEDAMETATCKLTNLAVVKTLYEGSCTVTQSTNGDKTSFSVKMGDTDPFVFSGVRGQKDWMTGSDKVDFTDEPTGGIFRWSTFVLVVAE